LVFVRAAPLQLTVNELFHSKLRGVGGKEQQDAGFLSS